MYRESAAIFRKSQEIKEDKIAIVSIHDRYKRPRWIFEKSCIILLIWLNWNKNKEHNNFTYANSKNYANSIQFKYTKKI